MENVFINRCGEVLKVLDECIENPDLFVQPQPEKYELFKEFTKNLYDLELKVENGAKINSKSLPRLLIKGFDEEAIWQQLELQNNAAIKYFGEKIQLISNSSKLKRNSQIDDDDDGEVESEENSVAEKDYVYDDDSSGEDSDESLKSPCVNGANKISNEKKDNSLKDRKKLEVEDRFFNLQKMEEFLELEELKEKKENDGIYSTAEYDDINMYQDLSSDEENDDPSKKKSSRDVMYGDFFDPPDCADENDSVDLAEPSDFEENTSQKKEYDTRDFDSDSMDEQSDVEPMTKNKVLSAVEDETMQTEFTPQTAFEKQQEKERKKIKEMEESLLKPKPWQLTGEVAASSRPENSLVHQPTMFDCNAKQDLLITDDLTKRVEEIVLNAVLNKAWNDVERKVKPKDDVRTYKKQPELDQTKSKKGLAEVYEEEYIKQHDKSEKNEDPKHLEIKKLMDTLIPELNALFAYIPKPPVPEIKVVSNLPAITIEEVAPVAISDGALLAPEEIKKKPVGDVKGKTERTETDRKRERRKKKLLQKLRQKRKDEKLKEISSTSDVAQKLVALKKLKQNRNTHFVNNESDKIKSSKDFFSRLEDATACVKKTRQKPGTKNS